MTVCEQECAPLCVHREATGEQNATVGRGECWVAVLLSVGVGVYVCVLTEGVRRARAVG